MHFSHRVEVSEPNPVVAAQRKVLATGGNLLQLNDSNPTHHGLGPGLGGIYDANPRGQAFAREALAAFLTERSRGERGTVGSDSLYLTSSTSQAYSWLIKLMCDPGESIAAPTPGYPLIESIARLEGVSAVPYPLRYDGSWTIDVPALESLVARREAEGSPVRALVLINPNNPTGSYVGSGDYERVIELCSAHSIALIADEVFFDFPLEPVSGRQRIAGEERVLTFGLDGFSKMLAAPQAKVGWIQVSGPGDDVKQAQRRLDVIADEFLPMSGIIAAQIPDLLAQVPTQLERTHERTLANLGALKRLLGESESGVVSLLRPEGGWNVLLRFPSAIDENDLVTMMIRERGITAQPGYFFDMTSNGYIAVSLLPEPEVFARGIHALLDSVDILLR